MKSLWFLILLWWQCFFLNTSSAQERPQITPQDTLYIHTGDAIHTIPAGEEKQIKNILLSHYLQTDSIIPVDQGYQIFTSPAARRMDSVVVATSPGFPDNVRRYIVRTSRYHPFQLQQRVRTMEGLRLYRISFWQKGKRQIMMIKAGYQAPPGGIYFQLTPTLRGEKWKWTGEGRLAWTNFLGKAEQMQLTFRFQPDRSYLTYGHLFPYIGGTAWHHRYQLFFLRQKDNTIAIQHRISMFFRRGNGWIGGGALFRSRRSEDTQNRISYMTLQSGWENHLFMGEFSLGLGGSRRYFVAMEAIAGNLAANWGHHRIRYFYSTDTSLVQTEQIKAGMATGWLPQTGRYQKHMILEDSRYYLAKNHLKWYIFNRIYAEFHTFDHGQSILFAGTGWIFEKNHTRWDISAFYPYYYSLPTDYKAVMISVKWFLMNP